MADTNILDFGAVADGRTLNTVAIQQAIESCATGGGGRVTIPAGAWLTGTLFLRSQVELHLCHAAVLKGSPHLADYNPPDAYPQNQVFTVENVTGAHLIIAHEVENCAITGNGTLDGNSQAFMSGPCTPPEAPLQLPVKKMTIAASGRPGQMVVFCECRKVLLEGVSLVNAPYWTCHIHGCEDVRVSHVTVRNPRETPNGDGIDIDCCSRVLVHGCNISGGDDAITLRGSGRTLRHKAPVCEQVCISDCILSTPCCALRIGVGDGTVRRVEISNLVIRNTRSGICIISKYSERQVCGTTIQDFHISNVHMEAKIPFYICTGLDGTARIENLHFDRIRVIGADRTSFIRGNGAVILRNLHFEQVSLEMCGGRPFMQPWPEFNPATHRNYSNGGDSAFYLHRVDDVSFRHCRISWGELDAPWQHAFRIEDSGEVHIDDSCRLALPPDNHDGQAVIRIF